MSTEMKAPTCPVKEDTGRWAHGAQCEWLSSNPIGLAPADVWGPHQRWAKMTEYSRAGPSRSRTNVIVLGDL
jgi:hypothetical protein